MAEAAFVIGATVGTAFNELYAAVKNAVLQVAWCHNYCQALQQVLNMHLPIFQQICFNLQAPVSEWEQRYLLSFSQKLGEGKLLLESCLQLRFGWANAVSQIRYSRRILKLQEDILLHLQQLPALNTLQLQQINNGLQDVREQWDKDHAEVMDSLKGGNSIPITEWARQLGAAGKLADEDQQGHRLDELTNQDQILVGIDAQIKHVKSLLLSDSNDKVITIVAGMGGIGKTTLVLSICKDLEVRCFFEDRIHFVTVSQSPDMRSLLCTIWKEVVGRPVPQFQTMEDAYRQVNGKLRSIMPSKRRLLVLDDVWSKAHLENLSFEVEGLKMMITTRHAPALQTQNSHTYRLDLLNEMDAESLFCNWAFGQHSIPAWVEEPQVVKEVILECKGLPLALRVIGASLLTTCGESPAAYWRVARDKLRDAKPLGEYQKDALLGRLQTSIDALDPMLRECFLDLGAHPEDSHWAPDFLLDTWVYVRGMEWVEAVLALVELGNRGLIDFSKTTTSVDIWRAVECNSARDLYISQHDVMRDLALQLGAIQKNHPPYSHCKRLLMPRQGENVPSEWQSEEAAMAEVISIHIGAMKEEDCWPTGLAFPHARALLLHFQERVRQRNHLPPFLGSMCKLKVMFIKGHINNARSTDVGDVVELQSLQIEGENSLSGFNLPKLEKLRDYGSDDKNILASLCMSRHLKVLDISFCLHVGPILENLGENWNALTYLRLLDCGGVEKLPQSLGNLSNLHTLELAYCHSLRKLPQSFLRLSNLKELYLRDCGLEKLPKTFGNLRGLERLSLEGCIRLQHLPESLGQLSGLRTLWMGAVDKMKSLPAAWEVGGLALPLLGSLERVSCDERMVPCWKALYPPGHPLPEFQLYPKTQA
ncbi:hypothetical protein GOP47_0014451 [Adiantum capillus-veneris]|uniref:Disease resistance protein n=1 Tax=Adiantum capillus-veneris TaxID=13818 RepID=A0A9D4ULH6_ADICA|nr:hypothetical protein GOP47_0014451 [Adiantum capillus-veneris]